MRTIPYGYSTINGKAVIDKNAASQVKAIFTNYLAGLSLHNAAKEANITASHCSIKRLLSNKYYLGDAFYPPLIGKEVFTKTQEELQKRASKLGRLGKKQKFPNLTVPTKFTMSPPHEHFEDTFEQAEYLYSLIESEAD